MLVSSERKPFPAIIHILFYCQCFGFGVFFLQEVLSHRRTSQLILLEIPCPLVDTTGCTPNSYMLQLRWKSTAETNWVSRKTPGQALRKLLHKWAPVKKPKNPVKERSDFWPGLKTALILVKKDKESLKRLSSSLWSLRESFSQKMVSQICGKLYFV